MLRSAGRPLGMLEVRDGARADASPPRDEAILAQLGQLAAVAIAKSQAYSRERHIAQVLQRSLLPPALPDRARRSPSPCASSPPGEGIEVGGDFYDFFAAAPGPRGRADRRRLRQGPGGGLRHGARAPHAARRGRLRAPPERGAAAPAPGAARRARRRALLHRRLLRPRAAAGRRADDARLRRPSAAARAARAAGCVEPVGQLGTLLGADVTPVAHRRRGASSRPATSSSSTRTASRRCAPARRELFGHRDLAAAARGLRAACPPTSSPSASQDAVLDAAEQPAARRHRGARLRPAAPVRLCPAPPTPGGPCMADPDQPVPAAASTRARRRARRCCASSSPTCARTARTCARSGRAASPRRSC